MLRSLGLALMLAPAGQQTALAHKVVAGPSTQESLCAAVRAAAEGVVARNGAGWRAEVRCRAMNSRPISRLARIQAERTEAGRLISGNQTWPVQVQPERGPAYVLAMPVNISWIAPSWVIARDQKAGDWLQATDLQVQEIAWPAGVAVEPARAHEPPQGRLRRALHAGEILRTADLLAADSLQRGDRVTVILAAGGLEMAMPAQVLAPTRVGQRVSVQADGRNAPMVGRLVDLTTVSVNNP